MFKALITTILVTTAGMAAAQSAPATPATPVTPVTIAPAKQALVQQVVQLWHVETVGQAMLQEPVADAVAQARAVLQGRVPADRRDAAMKDIADDARKFLDANTPLVTGRAEKLIPSTVEPLLAAHFSEDELRQIVAILQSPVKQKFEALVPDVQRALGEKLAADTGPLIDPKLQALKQQIGLRLRSAITP